ncbi:MAG: 5-formyltetrahydrofolate cyclo-ligase [Lachnospiraceae bacterium]|nr:5-formyltetrahydrofolate cyclo-ligase [Lachnospiraceae bacterium]
MEDKKAVRREMLLKRNKMHKNSILCLSEVICGRIAGLTQYRDARTILLYSSTGSEVQTDPLIQRAFEDGRTVCFPVCMDGTVMEAYVPCGPEGWKTGSFGIREPDPEKSIHVPAEDIDFIVCPCVSFDRMHRRLGMGGGYYDRYLRKAVNAFTVQAAFELQRFDGLLPAYEYDAGTDLVITEKGIF